MKRILFSAMAAIGLSLFSNNVDARSWRISSKPEAKANFGSINDAMASADVLDGDTLYLDPATMLTGTQTVTKQITIIGTGYFLKDAVAQEATVNRLEVMASNVKVEGCHLYELSGDRTYSNANFNKYNNLIIERCKIRHCGISYNNTKVYSCYIYQDLSYDPYNSSFKPINVEVSNCIILGYINGFANSSITNNTILYSAGSENLKKIKGSKIANNIIINTYGSYSNQTIADASLSDQNMITNNVLSNDADHIYADFPNNKFIGAKPEDVFTMTGIAEEQYRLKEDSPAKGYGQNGCDCGAYDGMFPYVVSGYPCFMPYISEISVPDRPTDGKINVKLKIKVQNE